MNRILIISFFVLAVCAGVGTYVYVELGKSGVLRIHGGPVAVFSRPESKGTPHAGVPTTGDVDYTSNEILGYIENGNVKYYGIVDEKNARWYRVYIDEIEGFIIHDSRILGVLSEY